MNFQFEAAPAPHLSRRISDKNSKKLAFSLVEVTMALGIVAFAFISVVGLLPTCLNTFHSAIDTSVGVQIAQRVINDTLLTDFDQLSLQPAIRLFDDQGAEIVPGSDRPPIYQANTVVRMNTTLPSNGNKQPQTNNNIATVVVEVVTNPGNRPLETDPNTGLLRRIPGLQISTYSAMVPRNR